MKPDAKKMKYSIDHKSSVPLHAQVEELIRKMAELKPYKEGKFLPNEVVLAKQLGISRNTLRQATSKLVYEGVLIRKKGATPPRMAAATIRSGNRCAQASA